LSRKIATTPVSNVSQLAMYLMNSVIVMCCGCWFFLI